MPAFGKGKCQSFVNTNNASEVSDNLVVLLVCSKPTDWRTTGVEIQRGLIDRQYNRVFRIVKTRFCREFQGIKVFYQQKKVSITVILLDY